MPRALCAALTLAIATCLPFAAHAGGLKAPPGLLQLAGGPMKAPQAMPPENAGQWWTNAAGCRYSRAGRPGEVVWFLTTVPRGASCLEFIVQKPIDNSYRAPRMYHG